MVLAGASDIIKEKLACYYTMEVKSTVSEKQEILQGIAYILKLSSYLRFIKKFNITYQEPLNLVIS